MLGKEATATPEDPAIEGYVTTVYTERGPDGSTLEAHYSSHEEIDRAFTSSRLNCEQSQRLHEKLDKKIETLIKAKEEIAPKLEATEQKIEDAIDDYGKCKKILFAAVPTTLLGATLKMKC